MPEVNGKAVVGRTGPATTAPLGSHVRKDGRSCQTHAACGEAYTKTQKTGEANTEAICRLRAEAEPRELLQLYRSSRS